MYLLRRSSSERATSNSLSFLGRRSQGKVSPTVKMVTTPREKISILALYFKLSSEASGGIYIKAPGMVTAALETGTIPGTPRIVILATILEFVLAVKSRWMMGGDCSCRYASPRATSCSTEHLRAMEKKAIGETASRGGGVSGMVQRSVFLFLLAPRHGYITTSESYLSDI